jgi:hypothetical protein
MLWVHGECSQWSNCQVDGAIAGGTEFDARLISSSCKSYSGVVPITDLGLPSQTPPACTACGPARARAPVLHCILTRQQFVVTAREHVGLPFQTGPACPAYGGRWPFSRGPSWARSHASGSQGMPLPGQATRASQRAEVMTNGNENRRRVHV